jgi:hypothetical protein
MAIPTIKSQDLSQVVLTEPYFYLNEEAAAIVEEWGENDLIGQLPCWIPHKIIAMKLFGANGPQTVAQAQNHFGPYVWATEFSNVHITFPFSEPHIIVDEEEFPGIETQSYSYQALNNISN